MRLPDDGRPFRRPDLRDYQEKIVEDLRRAIAGGAMRPLVSLPTGGGKTRLALAIVHDAVAKGHRVAVLTERNVLAEQWRAAAAQWGLDCGIIQATNNLRGDHLTVYSQQTIESRKDKMGTWPDEKVVIVDECHEQRSLIVEWIRNQDFQRSEDQIVIGLTATPMRPGLGDTFDHLVQGPTTKALTDEGYLVPMRVFTARAAIDMKGAKVNKATGEWTGKALDERTAVVVGDIAQEWAEMMLVKYSEFVHTIVFTPTIASGKKVVKAFNDLMPESEPIAAQVSADDKPDYRRETIERFTNINHERPLYVLVNCSVVGRGFDAPHAGILIDASPYRSALASYVQMIGRVLRPAGGIAGEEEEALIFDHAGNYRRFWHEWHEFRDRGVDRLKGDDEKKGGAWLCPADGCGTLTWMPDDECRACGRHIDPSPEMVRAWRCRRCDHPQHPESDRCVDCGAKRPHRSSDGGGGKAAPWDCPECSAVNPSSEPKCSVDGCNGEKPESWQQVEGHLVEEETGVTPVGVDTRMDLVIERRYVWHHLCELARRHYLKRQRSITAMLDSKAQAFAQARYHGIYKVWPGWGIPESREPEVDPRIEKYWQRRQQEYGAAARNRAVRHARVDT